MADTGERRFVAERIAAWLAGGEAGRRTLTGVSALGLIQVSEADLGRTRRLPSFRERLAARRQGLPGATPGDREAAARVTVPLLTAQQMTALRPALSVRAPSDFTRAVWWAGLLFLAGFYLAHAWLSFRGSTADQVLLPAIHLLCGVGLVMMVSLRDPVRDPLLFARFAQGTAAGCVLLAAATLVDFQRSALRRLSYVPLAGAVLLSALLIAFGSGPGTSDAKVNLLGVQPVEAIRLLVVLFLAGYFSQRWEFLRELKEPRFARSTFGLDVPRLDYVLPVVVGMALVLLFFFLQKDLGPALVLACVFLAMYGVARGRATMVAFGLTLLVAGFAAGYALASRTRWSQRVQMWWSPLNNAVRGGDQLAHAFWALGAGRVHRDRSWTGRPAVRAGRAHRPRPHGGGRRTGLRGAAGRAGRVGPARLAVLANRAARARRLHLLPRARPDPQHRAAAALDCLGAARPDAADRRGDALSQLRPVVDDRELRGVRRPALHQRPLARRRGSPRNSSGRRGGRRWRWRPCWRWLQGAPRSCRWSGPTGPSRPRSSRCRPTASAASSTTRACSRSRPSSCAAPSPTGTGCRWRPAGRRTSKRRRTRSHGSARRCRIPARGTAGGATRSAASRITCSATGAPRWTGRPPTRRSSSATATRGFGATTTTPGWSR